MADGHQGYVMPIGGVAAYRNQVSVVGIGFDIACANAAIQTDMRADALMRAEWEQLADTIQSTISFGVGPALRISPHQPAGFASGARTSGFQRSA